MKKVSPTKFLWLLIPIILFLVYKLLHFGVYFSDANGYFYTAYSILQGKILYKDIFFTNLPLYPYIVVLYFLLTHGNLYAFYFIQILEVIGTVCLIYYIVYKQTKSIAITTLCGIGYLSSIYVFLSSGIGINIAIIFALLGYIFLQRKRFVVTGILLALCFLTKAYFAPILLVFFLSVLIERRYKSVFLMLLSFSIVSLVILLPFMVLSLHNFWFDLFQYSLFKTGTFDKTGVLGSFIFHDMLFFFVSLISIIFVKKDPFFGLISIAFYSYFFFKYAVYSSMFDIIIPFMAVYLAKPIVYLQKFPELGKLTIPTIIFIYCLYTLFIAKPYTDLEKVPYATDMVEIIKQEKPRYIYGAAFITTALAYLSHTPLLDNLIDTDELLFANGLLDGKKLTQEAIDKKSIIVMWGIQVSNGITTKTNLPSLAVDPGLLLKKCKILKSYPFDGEIGINRMLMYKCY